MKFFMLKKIMDHFLIIIELEFQINQILDECLFASNCDGIKINISKT